jgi:zinc protease
MMFRGTERYSSEKYNDVIKAMGADSNAFTSDDITVYHILAGKQALPQIVEIEADRFQNLKYKEAEFQKEARAVLGEYNKSASNPLQKMAESLYDNAFQVHTYKHTTIGFSRTSRTCRTSSSYSLQFFDRYYRPDNVVLLVVGDVQAPEVFSLVERTTASGRRAPAARPSPPSLPSPRRSGWRSAGRARRCPSC